MTTRPRIEGLNWREARDMADLGTLTADWLDGRLPRHPGQGRARVSADLVPALLHLNSRRFVTFAFQSGCDETVGVRRRQRAAVSVLAWDERLADRLVAVSAASGLRVIDNGPARRWLDDRSTTMLVTTVDGRPAGEVGTHLSRLSLRWHIYPGVGRHAVRAAWDARQVTVIDPRWGRTGLLWPTLLRAVEGGR